MTTFFTRVAGGLSTFLIALTAATSLVPARAQAGVFNLPHFVQPGSFAIGLEPELTLSNGAEIGINLKYTHGLTDLVNVQGVLGTGSGDQRFRAGGSLVFDFFPDIEGQPGIGIATEALYYRVPNAGLLQVRAIPYIHKTFVNQGNEIEPYFSIPFGLAFSSGEYQAVSNIAIGSMFKNVEHLRYVLEVGVAINNAETYVSGGLVYYY